ncbi:MAG TPA: polysulfide reductase NrfD [Clostridia bacterium]|nr:polysulfide reductase NrfD [Clostridia bacterium]
MPTHRWSFQLTTFRKLLIALTVIGLVMIFYRLYVGLGGATNLNDQWPWGLWIGVDLSAIALAGTGFSVAVLANILNIKKYKTVVRHSLLISFLTYIFVLAVLIIEIGRWDNFWRPFVSWGYHSPMFEVFMCVAGYTLMQLIEFAEIVTEKIGQKWHKLISILMPAVIIIAALLPFGHQASLGAIYLIMAGKLDPLWFSPLLPWFFLISSFFVGPAVISLETLRVNKKYSLRFDDAVIKSLLRVSGYIMLGYLVLKIYDLAGRGMLGRVFAGTLEGNMLLLELAVGVIIPIIICFTPWLNSRPGQIAFCAAAIAGVVLSRVNVVFTGMYRTLGPGYVPSWMEWVITVSLFALVLLVYLFVIENFNIFTQWEKKDTGARDVKLPVSPKVAE